MTQILWLASYPKSGNTWLRAFVANYLHDGAEPEDINALPRFNFGDIRIEFREKVCGIKAANPSRRAINKLRSRIHRRFANAPRFLHRGRVGVRRQTLSQEHVDRIVDCHRETMIEMGYLSSAGKLLV